MKKLVCILASALLLVGLFAGCSPKKEGKVLKVYSWKDYIAVDDEIDLNILEDFEKYYKATYGEEIHVDYQTFDTNETMLTKIEKGKQDYDIVCPSDYMIQIMLSKGLLKEIDTSKVSNYTENLSSFIKDQHKAFENQSDGKVYSVSYMWGTMGIVYNVDKVRNIDKGWEVLWDSQYRNKVEMKDSVRDTFAIASIYANLSTLEAALGSDDYNETLTNVMNDTSEENIERVEKVLKEQKKLVNPNYEVDAAKSRLITGESWLGLAWSGDAIFAMQKAAEENKIELAYEIPDVGSNLWFDGWVLPKYGKDENYDAACAFINYMISPEAAQKNMDYIGYTSGVTGRNSEMAEWLPTLESESVALEQVNLKYLFGTSSDFNVNAPKYMYPDNSIIDKLAIMKDFGTETDAVMKMWNSVRVNTLAIVLIVVLSVVAAAAIAVVAYFIIKKKKGQAKSQVNKTKTQGYRPE